MNNLNYTLLISGLVFVSVYLLIRFGEPTGRYALAKLEDWYRRVLVQQLLIDIPPRAAVFMAGMCILITGLFGLLVMGNGVWFVIGCVLGAFIPNLLVKHLEQKRRERLNAQIIDGITTLASGVRAGLNLVQSMELLAQNTVGPIQQEFAQLLREYSLGLDLNVAMHNASNRIGSQHYRLLFTAIEMHRLRGGDAGESLDRIAEAIREIQRLEGKLDAVTSQGRMQSWMMAGVGMVLLLILWMIEPTEVNNLFAEPSGRILLLIAAGLAAIGFYWIQRIMQVDI
ncbi:MAG: hypothetical protein GC164_10760 [Phycisphaera sp.]|nr:hypothetical protein [Phycisphaera sp.]